MTPVPKRKKLYFKKEKKSLQPKRHKASSEKTKSVKGKVTVIKQPQIVQFPKISRFIPESFDTLRTSLSSKCKTKWLTDKIKNVILDHLVWSPSVTEALKKKERAVFGRNKTPSNTFGVRNIWMLCLFGISVGFALLLTGELMFRYRQWQQAQTERAQLMKDLQTWEGVTKRYSTYRDAYFEAAVLAYRLGKTQKEQEFLQKLRQIDPNFGLAQELEKISRGK